VFTAGKWSDGFACPALPQTVATLAKAWPTGTRCCALAISTASTGSTILDMGPNNTEGHARQRRGPVPGKPAYRESFYAAILSDKAPARKSAPMRFTAASCAMPPAAAMAAAPSRTNEAYNQAQAPKSQRKAWYDELKGKYPDSPWAKKLRYYW
jgi:hypothetical protein